MDGEIEFFTRTRDAESEQKHPRSLNNEVQDTWMERGRQTHPD